MLFKAIQAQESDYFTFTEGPWAKVNKGPGRISEFQRIPDKQLSSPT